MYRQAIEIEKGNRLAGAITGLGETGQLSDIAVMKTFLDHPLAKIRISAIRAISNLDAQRNRDILMNALLDDRPKVIHEALVGIQLRKVSLDPVELISMFRKDRRLVARRAVLSLAASFSKWDTLAFHLQAATIDEMPAEVLEALESWLASADKSFIKLSPAQRSEINGLLNNADLQISDKQLAAIRRHINRWADEA